ncbi:DUF5722 domain-containing protein [Roseiconus lacunae]|uniref:DUF5722 domain-containing protein n=1 Tax=Roseiconus lacunae TaxID=2605694 RepID=UPI0011F30FF2|nr:DUF5722 domain-containing protein [Roseiconus lacunae]
MRIETWGGAALCLGCQVILLANLNASGQQFALDLDELAHRNHHVELTHERSVGNQQAVTFRTQGTDPFVWFRLPSLPSKSRDWILEAEYFCPSGIKHLEWRMGDNAGLSPIWHLPPVPKAEGWTRYTVNLNELLGEQLPASNAISVRVDLGARPDVRLNIRRAIIRPISDHEEALQRTARERRVAKEQLAKRIADHHSRSWPATINRVRPSGDRMIVVGQGPPSDGAVVIVAREPHEIAANPIERRSDGKVWPVKKAVGTGEFEMELAIGGQDWLPGTRLQLASLVDGGYEPISAEVYPEIATNVRRNAPPKLHAAKGLTCVDTRFSSQMLRDLGLKHASVNMLLNRLVSASPRQGWEKRSIAGKTWWVNEQRLVGYDRNIERARKAGCVVAGILLIHPEGRSDENETGSLTHPEASDEGSYTMPNLTSRESVRLYAAILEVLAERYGGANPDRRIDHWIAHNEVDYGWQWTNMGEQPMDVFTDHYLRSMRLIDAVTRKHNPHAHVFISLTHRWNATDCLPWKTYPPRDMLSRLVEDTKQHGEFAWGVAYHPYPQSLWNADFWNDTHLDQTDQTPLITMKNLTVLDRWMHRSEVRKQDFSVRPVICSEQGYHAVEDQPEQLRTQSIALLKTWEILRQCPSILAYDYHRPVDHPNEGGLRLGLRGLPSAGHPIGKPKPAWDVFKAINTDDEAELRASLGE